MRVQDFEELGQSMMRVPSDPSLTVSASQAEKKTDPSFASFENIII